MKLGFIGVGNMGSALVRAAAKSVSSEDILVSDKAAVLTEKLSAELGVITADNKQIAGNAKYIFLGVKPQMMEETLREIAPVLKERGSDFILVSMAAGLTTKRIASLAGDKFPIIRIMPNTPALIGQGMILLTAANGGEHFSAEFAEIMRAAGSFDVIDERLMDSGSALSGCGPAFVYMFIESLVTGAVKCGLPPEKALEYAAQTVKGAAEMVQTQDKPPSQLREEVCSKGGSTIEGVKSLQSDGFAEICIKAVEKSYKRTKELGE